MASGTHEEINSGSLQRIADAAEKIAVNYTVLINERNNFKRWYEEGQQTAKKLSNKNRSLRGVVTKLKRQLAAAKGGAA